MVWAEAQANLVTSVMAITDGDVRRAESILRDVQVGARDLVVADVARTGVFVVYCLRHAQGQLAQLEPLLMPSVDQIPVARLDLLGPVLLALVARPRRAA